MTTENVGRWSPEKAHAWNDGLPWLVGCNYNPAYAGNQLEWLARGTFDVNAVARELDLAQQLGFTSLRIYLHDLCWQEDRAAFLDTLDRLLGLAEARKIGVLFVLFESCWHPFPRLGRQREPEPFVHNSVWVQSPGVAILRDPLMFANLEDYVTGVIGHFRDDHRIHGWDLWNEPDNANSASYGPRDLGAAKGDTVLPLLRLTFSWARSARPCQPLTSAIWHSPCQIEKFNSLQRYQVEASDIVSFHCYNGPNDLEAAIADLAVTGRPLWCTEFLARGNGSTFAACLPVLHRHRVGAYNWGFVQGRTQTHMSCDSWGQKYDCEAQPWHHEIFRPDGSPYDATETTLIRLLATTGSATTLAGRGQVPPAIL